MCLEKGVSRTSQTSDSYQPNGIDFRDLFEYLLDTDTTPCCSSILAKGPETWIFYSIMYIRVASLSQRSNNNSINRRDVAALLLIGAGGAGFGLKPTECLAADSDGPVAVLGANGRTGALCVTACLDRGIPVLALTRTGTWTYPPSDENKKKETSSKSSLLSVAACDIQDPAALMQSIKGCRAVIYAASASKKGGNAKAIDHIGVVEAGKACLQQRIPRYVVLSSTATTRPKSLGYIFTNLSVGGIMDEKRKGEQEVIQAYADKDPISSFTIVRPGGLEEPKLNKVLGPSSLEISQGDTLAGIISRADLAEVTVELALSNAANLRNTALELYYTDSVQPCESRFKSQITDGIRLHGETYQDLFRGVQPSIDCLEV
eukprot:scaffold3151_cov110-Cylindrotheca_fusiformis.AAC.8